MTRVKISLGILFAMICMSISFGIFVNKKCSSMIAEAEHIRELCLSGSSEDAYTCSKKLEKEWNDFRCISSILIDSEKLIEIDRISSRIVSFADSNSDELCSELAEMNKMLDILKKSETPALSTVF